MGNYIRNHIAGRKTKASTGRHILAQYASTGVHTYIHTYIHTLPPKGKSLKKGDFADEVNQIANGLKMINSKVPFLIVHADPGMIVRKQAIEYAKTNFQRVSFANIGTGKHYLTEDHPVAIGVGITNWIKDSLN